MTNAYTTKQVAENLALSTSSIRNYCRAIEEAGYMITRNDKDQRVFLDSDVMALRRMSALIDGGKTMQEAAASVAKSLETTALMTAGTQEVNMEETIRELTNVIEILNAKLDTVVAEQKQARIAFEKAINDMDERQAALIEMKVQEETAAASEDVTQNKRGLFSKLFGRGK